MRSDSGYISNTWLCCNCMNDHSATWSPELRPILIGPPWSCCNCMIMLQLHWLIHLFTKLGQAMYFVVTAWINCVGLDWGNTSHSQEWHSAGNNCRWLADPKATISEPKCIYPALRQQNTRGVIRLLDFVFIYDAPGCLWCANYFVALFLFATKCVYL